MWTKSPSPEGQLETWVYVNPMLRIILEQVPSSFDDEVYWCLTCYQINVVGIRIGDKVASAQDMQEHALDLVKDKARDIYNSLF